MTETNELYLLVSNPAKHEDYGGRIVILVVFFVVSIILFFFGFSHKPYIDFLFIIGGVFFLILGLINLRKVLGLTTFKISDTTLFSKSKTGKPTIINRKDLVSFHEKKMEEKRKNGVYKWNELVFFSHDDHIVVSERIHPDYKKIKLTLTNGLKDFFNGPLYRQKGKIERKMYASLKLFTWGILCISFPILKFVYLKHMASDLKYDQLTEIKGTVKAYPVTLTAGKSKRETGLRLELKEYPYFEFSIYNDYFNPSDYTNLRNVIYTDKQLSLYVSLDEYKKKFSKELPIKFNDKYFGFNSIMVFGAKYDDIEVKRIKIKPSNNPGRIEFDYLNGAIMYVLIGLFAVFMYLGTERWREYKELIIEQEEGY